MMPGNVLSDPTIQSPLLEPDSWDKTPFKDFERGGAGIGNTAQGINVFNWEAWVDVDYNFWVKRVDQPSETAVFITRVPGATNIGLAFDRSMNVAISYRIGANSYLYWFDTSVSAYVTTQFAGARSPAITHDDKRDGQDNISDVLLFYVRADVLYMRMQRDRYEIEYTMKTIPANYEIKRVGMGRNLRIQFVLAPRV